MALMSTAMAIIRQLSLLSLYQCILFRCVHSTLSLECLPTEIGEQFSAICTGESSDGYIGWDLYFPSALPIESTSFCTKKSCDDVTNGSVFYEETNSTHFQSELQITNPDHIYHNNGIVKCFLAEFRESRMIQKNTQNCTVKFYSQPSNPSCSITSLLSNVQIECYTSFVDPDLNCDIQQTSNVSAEVVKINKTLIWFEILRDEHGLKINSAWCKTNFTVPRPGIYNYQVTMYAKLDNRPADHFKGIGIKKSVVINTTAYSVEIKGPGPQVFCLEEIALRISLTCHVNGLQNRPFFSWLVENEKHQESSVISNETSYLQLEIQKSDDGKTICCTVRPEPYYQASNKCLDLQVDSVPRRSVMFQTQKGKTIKDIFYPPLHKTSVPLHCVADASYDKSKVWLQVYCKDLDGKIFNSFNSSDSVYFTVVNYLYLKCSCIANVTYGRCNHKSLMAQIEIVPISFKHNVESLQSEDSAILDTKHVTIVIIVVGLACLVVCIMVGLFCRRKKRPPEVTRTPVRDKKERVPVNDECSPYATTDLIATERQEAIRLYEIAESNAPSDDSGYNPASREDANANHNTFDFDPYNISESEYQPIN